MSAPETSRKGFVLLLTLIVMMTLSSIAATLIYSLTTDFRAAAVQSNDAKAFWLAEGGIADAIKRIKNDEIVIGDGTTDNTSIQNVSFGGGTYSVTLSRNGSDITMTSTGTFAGQSRTVTQIQTVASGFPAAFDYAIFGMNPAGSILNIGNSNSAPVSISGSIYYDRPSLSDTVRVRNSAEVINGLIYTDTVLGHGQFTQATGPPNPVPTFPVFSTTSYDNQIVIADSVPRSNLNLTGTSNLNLAGGTHYYQKLTLRDNSTITGPGTIVTTDTVTLRNNSVVGQGVKIISETEIQILNSSVVQQGGVLYGRRDITIQDNTNVSSSIILPLVSTNRRIHVLEDAVVTGIVFGNSLRMGGNAVINGSVVVEEISGNNISNNAKINFDESYLPASVPTGFSADEVFEKKPNSWKEL